MVPLLSQELKEFGQYKKDVDLFWNRFSSINKMIQNLK